MISLNDTMEKEKARFRPHVPTAVLERGSAQEVQRNDNNNQRGLTRVWWTTRETASPTAQLDPPEHFEHFLMNMLQPAEDFFFLNADR